MKIYLTIIFAFCFMASAFSQHPEPQLNFNLIKTQLNDRNFKKNYSMLMSRYQKFDPSLTLDDYAVIYYGYTEKDEILKTNPNDDFIKRLFTHELYYEVAEECEKVLEKNPLNLFANDYMSFALHKMGLNKNDWEKYQTRYRMLKRVIVLSKQQEALEGLSLNK